MKNSLVNISVAMEQWYKFIKHNHTANDKMKGELSSALSQKMENLVNKIFLPDSSVIRNLKNLGGSHEVHSHE